MSSFIFFKNYDIINYMKKYLSNNVEETCE